MQKNLTEGNIFKNLLIFSIPYLISCFLQTFYGMADLYITGQYNGAASISGVSIGSQVTHLLTVVIIGLAMGTTVSIGSALGQNASSGSKQEKEIKRAKEQLGEIVAGSVILFSIVSIVGVILLFLSLGGIIRILDTPAEAVLETTNYLKVCFLGFPFIVMVNVISSVYRGMGDSKSPMIFVAISGVINIILDYVLIGYFGMGALGAAIATVVSQIISVIIALFHMLRSDLVILKRSFFKPNSVIMNRMLKTGLPIAVQEGVIQISFLVITAIANGRGVTVSASVGIVEKIISFLFLVPSAMLSTVSAIAAQCRGAKLHDRSRKTLFYAVITCVLFGLIATIVCETNTAFIVGLFAKGEPDIVVLGAQYLRAYVFDCIIAGIHFCFCGFFSAYEKSYISSIHNILSVCLIRIPGAYFATKLFPDDLFPMGLAAPAGSLLSALICIGAYLILKSKEKLFN